ncbi:MAG TPA: hypothetical protein VFQ76_12500 [Longimicrobiaceae bacterium]|nr:hypothetical protein [Longimicrobiaceae bacterium]
MVERTILVARLAELVEDAGAPQVSRLRTQCPGVAAFIQDPFDASSPVPGAAQLAAAVQVLTVPAPGDTSALPSPPPPPPPPPPAFPATADRAAAALLGGGGGLTPLAFAEGARTFIVERAKDELVYAFVLKLGEDVEKQPFVQYGFPRSYALVRDIQIGTFQTLMPAVRSALSEDLQLLPGTLGTDAALTQLASRFPEGERDRARGYLAGLGLLFRHGAVIRQGAEPAAVLSSLLQDAAALREDDAGRVALRLTGAFAHEYSAGGSDRLGRLLREPSTRLFFAAFLADDLLRREGWRRADGQGAVLLGALAARRTELPKLEQHLRTAEGVAALLRSAGAEPDDRRRAERFLAASGTVLQAVGTALQIVPSTLQAGGPATQLGSAVTDAARLNGALASRDYSVLIGWVMEHPALRAAAGPAGIRYLGFASTLAAARTTDEVATALRTASTPVGSYRAKRNQFRAPPEWSVAQEATSPQARGPLAVTVTGFVGGAYGREETRGLAGGTDGEVEDDYYGVALPVGLELSYGMPFGSVSLFAPLLDVGTITSRRAGEEAGVREEAEVGWNQLLAPGIFATVGFRDIPLVLGYGVQRVEDLRESADGTRTVDVYRRGIFVGIDVTVFRVH